MSKPKKNGITINQKSVLGKMLSCWQLYLFVLPAIIYLIIFNYIPMYGVQLAFKYFQPNLGIEGSPWVGFDNFIRYFNSHYFWRLIENTLVLNIYNLILGFPFPIILALMMNEIMKPKLKKAVQTIMYAPYFISVVVIVGILTVLLNMTTGFVNVTIQNLGFEAVPFLTDSGWFRHVYVFSDLWTNVGWNSIIYIAALTGVDPALHEAAQIDGASKFKRIIHINIPAIAPTAVILFILQAGRMMNLGFEKVFLLQNGMNIETSEVISTFVYTQGLLLIDYGYSTAIGLFNNIINIILLLTFNKLAQKLGSNGLF